MRRLPVMLVPFFCGLVSRAAAADTYVPPETLCGGCAPPVVDGEVLVEEYANGVRLPLQDYGIGGDNGTLFLALDRSTLYVGARVHEGGAPPNGLLSIMFDTLRNDTLNGAPGADRPRQEDRYINLRYDLRGGGRPPEPTQVEGAGNQGAWVDVPVNERWPVVVRMSQPPNDPGFVNIELAITMRPDGAAWCEPVASGLVGFGLLHQGGDGSYEDLPNSLVMPDARWTMPWETLRFTLPPPIPLTLTTYNVGQMPAFLGDGGAGDPEDFAEPLFDKEVVCINEMWSNGDVLLFLDEIQARRAAEGWDPYYVRGLESSADDLKNLFDDDGLLLLSSRPFLDGGELTYSADSCAEEDCIMDKGAIWGRVLIEGGTPDLEHPAANGNHFVDVYCTHLQADYEGSDHSDLRHMQREELHDWIDTTRGSATDRPAFILGDMNADGHKPGPDYVSMMDDLHWSSPFDALNGVYSDTLDLGLVNDPALGTWVSSPCVTDQADLGSQSRLDYVLVASATDEWPRFAVVAEPGVSVDPQMWPMVDDVDCLSDHGMLEAKIELVETGPAPAWNHLKDHVVQWEITHLQRFPTDESTSWFSKAMWHGAASASFWDADVADGPAIDPHWVLGQKYTGSGTGTMSVEIWDADGADSQLDCADDGLTPHYGFDHMVGDWDLLDDAFLYEETLGSFYESLDPLFTISEGLQPEDTCAVHSLLRVEEM